MEVRNGRQGEQLRHEATLPRQLRRQPRSRRQQAADAALQHDLQRRGLGMQVGGVGVVARAREPGPPRAQGGLEEHGARDAGEGPVLAAHDVGEVEGVVVEEGQVVEWLGVGGGARGGGRGGRGVQAGGAGEDVDPGEGGDEVL